MADETTPDAVAMLQRMHARAVDRENHGDVPRIGSDEVLAVLRAAQAERARHAEEVAALHDQLRKVEGERDAERKHATEMEERALDLVRDLRLAQVELASLRALLPDVRACAEYCRNMIGPPPGIPVEDYPLPPVALAARRILAAIDQKETPTP